MIFAGFGCRPLCCSCSLFLSSWQLNTNYAGKVPIAVKLDEADDEAAAWDDDEGLGNLDQYLDSLAGK